MNNTFKKIVDNLGEDDILIIDDITIRNESIINNYLPNSTFNRVTFFNINFNNVYFKESSFNYCNFKNCKFSKVNFRKCQFWDATFKNCELTGSTLIGSSLLLGQVKNCIFTQTNLIGTDFDQFKFIDTKFDNCGLNFISGQSIDICRLNHCKEVQSSVDLGKFFADNLGNFLSKYE